MRADVKIVLALLVAALAVAGGCGGSDQRPVRVGVLVDCVGNLRSLEGAELSGAQLPLLERGARRLGPELGDGMTDARVGGRRVQLVPACSETMEFTTLFQEVRRLVELEHVDALVAGSVGLDGIGLRDVARRFPTVAFVTAATGPREVTLRERPENLFRVAPDYGQAVAGLGTYAYRELGWRRVAVISFDWDLGWGSTSAFVNEFCSLGGQVVEQRRVIVFDVEGAAGVVKLANRVDGIALMTTGFISPQNAFIGRLVAGLADPAKRLVVGPGVLGDDATMNGVPRLTGIVAAAAAPPARASRSVREYADAYADAFGSDAAGTGSDELTIVFRNGVEAVLQALEASGGDPSRITSGLSRLDATFVGVPMRIDANGQAVVQSTLVRIGKPVATGVRPTTVVREIAGVDQSIGGILAPGVRPASADVPCRRSTPPPWAR